MKTMKTKAFVRLSSDFKTSPTLEQPFSAFKEKDAPVRKKKKKKLYQLNRKVDDVSINDLRDKE